VTRIAAPCLLVCLFLGACVSSPQPSMVFNKEPQLGATVPLRDAPSRLWLTGPSQMSDSYLVSFDKVRYIIAVDPLQRIRYIETTDESFRTRDGLRIGNTATEVMTAGGSAPINEAGFGRYSHLQSGWNAHYGTGADEQTVISFFKRE